MGGAGGYSSVGIGGAAGNGSSSLTVSDSVAGYLGAQTYGYGGAGGAGSSGAVGGMGTASTQVSGAHAGYAWARAFGGYGGAVHGSKSGVGGAGGSATSSATETSTTTGKDYVGSYSYATGGSGRAGFGTGSGGAGGAVTGATATTTETKATGGRALANARATGGAGGAGYGAGNTGGAGGVSSGVTASASGYSASISVSQTGGAGGGGYSGATGGGGASSNLVNAASGTTKGGYLTLSQTASGGTGGYSSAGNGGAGGAAATSLTFSDKATNTAQASTVNGTSSATGGAGGGVAGSSTSSGGSATADVNLTGSNIVKTTATASGGTSQGKVSVGGAASANSIATSVGTASTAVSTASATATGGVGGTQGTANALAQATTAAGQQAQANATATGASGLAQTAATTNGTGFVLSFTGNAQSQTISTGSTAESLANAVNPFSFNGSSIGSYAFGTIAPNAAYVSNALSTHSKVAAAFSSPYSAVIAAGVQGAYETTKTTASQEFISSENFTLNAPTMSGHLILGLLDTQALKTGFTSLVFTVTVGGVTDVSQTFTTLAAAQSYFQNDAIDLGTFSSSGPLAVGIKFDLTAAAAGVGYGQDFILGVTDGNAPPVLSGPASTIVQQSQTNAISGVKVTEANALPAGQTVTVTLADTTGLLAVTAGGATVTGSGTNSVKITGTTAQVNAALATLTDANSVYGTDNITLNSTDTRGGYAAPVIVGVSVNAPTSITVGGAQILTQNKATAIAGVSVADPDAGSASETLTVTVVDTVGLLVATGTGVSGAGTTSLTITGTLAQVNADLATLTDSEATPGSDIITINANDGRGGNAPQQTIGLTISGTPALSAPTNQTIGQGKTAAVAGVALAETNVTGAETFTVTLSDTLGLLSATGPGVTGSGSTSLTISGSLAQVNAALATLTDGSAAAGSDTITLNATDSNGGAATPASIGVSFNAPPAITAPSSLVIGQGVTSAIAGVILSEIGNTSGGETFSVTLSDAVGLLSATGTGVSGAGTTSLTISGSLAQVNADLATLTDSEAGAGSDTLSITASDSLGNAATPGNVALTINGPPSISAPSSETFGQGRTTAVSGISIAEAGNLSGETFTVTLSDTMGLLSATGTGVTGSGTTSLTITGSLAQVNADLATLTDSTPTAGADTIKVSLTDSLGGNATPASIGVTTNGLPVITNPATATAPQGKATAISGVSLSETGNTAGETFTVTLTDLAGLLTATGTGVSGSGTKSLTITGSLAQVNADLATLAVLEAAPFADTLTMNAIDSLGDSASTSTIAVTTNGPVITVPGTKIIGVGHATTISKVSLSLIGPSTKGETYTVILKDTNGLLSATGSGVTGSGTNTLTITGTLGVVNGDLATLQDTNAFVGKDTIKISASDSLGETATSQNVAVIVNGLPVVAAPTGVAVTAGKATAIPGVILSEAGTTTGETFTVTLTDTNGLLSAKGKGITGSGTTKLTISGSLSQVNTDLKSLTDTDSVVSSDTITITATDSLGNAGAPVSIAVTVGALAQVPGGTSVAAFVAAMAGHPSTSAALSPAVSVWDHVSHPILAAGQG